MDKPSTDIEICNLALDRLGTRGIASLITPTTETENICARHYDQTRRWVLRRFLFNFAKKYATLEESTDVSPSYGYDAAFYLPDDFIRLLSVGNLPDMNVLRGRDYDIVENYLYTSLDDDGDLKVSYIKDAKLVTEFDPLFIDVLQLKLAANMSPKFVQKPSVIREIRADLADAVLAAAAISGQEKPPVRIESSKWIAARQTGRGNADNTRMP